MAVAFDAETVQTATFDNETTKSVNHTSAGSDRYVLVLVGWAGGAAAISSVTYGGTTMGAALVSLVDAGNDVAVAVYGRAAPPTGSTAAAVTFDAGSYGGMAVISFSGVDQSTPTTDTDSAQGNTTAPSITLTTAADEMLVDVLNYSNALDQGTGDNQTARAHAHGGFTVSASVSTQAGSDGGVMSWQAAAGAWAQAAISLKAATGGGGETITVDKWLSQERIVRSPRYKVVASGLTPPQKIN